MQGNRIRQINKLAVQVHRIEGFTVFVAGYSNTGNSHAGVSVCINNSLVPPNCIHSVCHAEGRYNLLQGRVLAVRTRSNSCDTVHICMYFPPCTARGAVRTCKLMLEWCSDLFRSMPTRTHPIIYMDANSQFGIQPSRQINVPGKLISSEALGPFGLGVENESGVKFENFSRSGK